MKRLVSAVAAIVVALGALATVNINEAITQYRAGELAVAQQMFTAAAGEQRDPLDHVLIHSYLGSIYNRTGRPEEAVSEFDIAEQWLANEAIASSERERLLHWVRYEKQEVQRLLGQQEERLKTLDALVRDYPDDVDVAYDYGLVLVRLGCYEQGRTVLADVLERDTDSERREACESLLKSMEQMHGTHEWRDGELVELPSVPVETTEPVVVYAQFPGGLNALYAAIEHLIVYPESAKKQNLQGKVVVNAHLTAEGVIDETSIHTSVSPELDAEALRVVRLLPPFTPASIDGEPVGANVQIPVYFRLY